MSLLDNNIAATLVFLIKVTMKYLWSQQSPETVTLKRHKVLQKH